jgi:hypothetical protein
VLAGLVLGFVLHERNMKKRGAVTVPDDARSLETV